MTDSIHPELKFPEDLVLLWNSAHNIQPGMPADVFSSKWIAVQKMLSGYIIKNRLPGIVSYQDAQDATNDYLVSLFSGICPDNVISHSALIANMRKYLAMKRNPVQYELSQILHLALRTLEKEGLIKRDESSIGKHISGQTLFLRTDRTSDFRASRENYERNRKNVPFYRTVVRANDLEHSKIIPPESAKDLILNLLDSFEGWTDTKDLLWAMQFHVSEQLKFIPEQELVPKNQDPDSPAGNPISDLPDGQADTFIYAFDQESGDMIAEETAQQIWIRVSEISDKVFCLYFLPKSLSLDYSAKLEDFGPSSTVSDQNRNLKKIMEEELQNYASYSEVSERERIAMKAVLNKISLNLHRNCTEKGYNMPLLSDETGKEQ